MRMPPNELGVHALYHVIDGEASFLLGNPGIECNKEKQIPEFIFQPSKISGAHGIHHFVGFFQQQPL
jgi:hypothetical protein